MTASALAMFATHEMLTYLPVLLFVNVVLLVVGSNSSAASIFALSFGRTNLNIYFCGHFSCSSLALS